MRGWLFGLSALIIGLDRWTKHLVSHHIGLGDAITVIPGVFRISHVLNSGAAFSLFTDSPHPEHTRWFLIAFSLIAAIVVLGILLRIGRRMTLTAVALALVLGGDIGNLWDRMRTGLVVDFLEVHIVHYHWPDFNVADSAIVTGGILLLLATLFTKDESHA
ncbi:signal peptidase II [Silvibacterium dinghuense]|uniref:Lipoprotein signal peptidase n=2 Tax=Silvibacterium dinghuense TaxID=1560006 RepID=A0A4V1NVH0_9BACT|nr:signal peptidase II [Silvibacterium dinghuense]